MAKIKGLYVHLPFCEKKCKYCSFYSIEDYHGKIDDYINALENEAKRYYRGEKIKIRTLYIGGGTPSVLNISQWQKLMNVLNKYFELDNLQEATTEANPNSISQEHVKFWKDNNFSRISLGIQSMNNNELKTLGRIHDNISALKAMELVKNSGLNLSCDLIFAIPGQTLRTWDNSLRQVMNFASHISTYQLTLEPESILAKELGDIDLNASRYYFYRYAQYFLPRKNFMQYEISNFAQENYECRHNILYWQNQNVLALGASAVSYIDGVRSKNPATLEKYLNNAEIECEKLPERERKIENIILSMRTAKGIEREKILPEIMSIIKSMPEDLFVFTEKNIALSKKGMRVGNSIWSEFIV